MCTTPLKKFLSNIKIYDKTLRKIGQTRNTAEIHRLAFGQHQIRKLQSYLNAHVGTVDMLLAEHGLETMNFVSSNLGVDQMRVRERWEVSTARHFPSHQSIHIHKAPHIAATSSTTIPIAALT